MLANYEIAIINSKALRMGSYASFDKFFRTTSMGIPNTQNLPTATTMNIRFYLISLMLEGILLLVFAFFFVMAILRVVKKIKNSKFDPPDEDEMLSETVKEEHTMNKSESLSENKSSKSANDNLIYRFDEQADDDKEDPELQKNKEVEAEDEAEVQRREARTQAERKAQQQQEYNDIHDQHEEDYLQLDHKLLFLQPFFIGFIICNNLFAADEFTIVSFVLMLVSYGMFNIKGMLPNVRIAPLFFIVPALASFLPFFYNDHDLTT